jgi:acylphosphatase
VDEKALKDFYSCAGRESAGARQISCSARNLDDGSVLITYEQREGDLVRRVADVLRADGTRVVITAVNGADGKYGPATSEAPAYTQAQLAAVASSPEWRAWV